jgi:excisionase family DNA binding protein
MIVRQALRRAEMTGKLLKVREAADRLGLGKSKVFELIARGELDSVKIDGARRISERAIDEFIASREAAAKVPA